MKEKGVSRLVLGFCITALVVGLLIILMGRRATIPGQEWPPETIPENLPTVTVKDGKIVAAPDTDKADLGTTAQCPDPRDLRLGAMSLIGALGTPYEEALHVWLSHDYAAAQKRVDKERACIESTMEWAKSLADPCARQAYLSALAEKDKALDGAQSEIDTHKIRDEMEAYTRKAERESARADEIRAGLPPPPKCPR